MPVNRATNTDDPHPKKRPRLETAQKYLNASQIRTALRTDNPEALTEALTSLRNQLTVKPQEPPISSQDERLALVRQWMDSAPVEHDLFGIWDQANSRQSTIIALIISLLSAIIDLLSAHYNNHASGQPIMKALLNPTRLRQLNSFIGGSNNELIIVTLKLFNVMSTFAGGRHRKSVLEGFGWEMKSLPKLLNMRRKTHGEKDLTDPLLRPDIRTLYVLLLLSFVSEDTPTQTKSLFLEQHREAFLAIFKGFVQDHYSLARKVLEVCWAGIWSDAKLKRTLKVGLFNETTLGHLIKLYDRVLSEYGNEDHVPANLVHHFLLAICTRAGSGICFKDRGWYPRESDPDDVAPTDDEDGKRKYGKIYNKILANFLKTLKVNEDSRQQELAIKILSACPELVSGYWYAVALTLEPRLSSKWITNIAVFGSIISLPLPSSSFLIPNTQLYQPTPPPLSTVLDNILPSVNTKNNFSKGLQSPSGLVQHCTALALCKSLVKYQTVQDAFHKIASALEEDEEEGQWYKRCSELRRELRRRVPDFQVLVAFSQQKHANPKSGQVNQTKMALLTESAQRLLWLYHRCLPSIVAEVRFDVGKLLQTFVQDPQVEDEGIEDEETGASDRLYRVQQLHVLSLLKDSDQFVWSSKIASLSHTPFYILLTVLSSASIPAIRTAITSLLQHVLSQSILFQEDPNEPELWLKIFPRRRIPSVNGDPSLFQGESNVVISFVDECVQRCLKTPYRYIEALHELDDASGANGRPSEHLEMYPSPLLMTVIEQLDAKLNNDSLPPSHIIGVASFIRKLLVNLAGKTSDIHLLRLCADKVYETLRTERFSGDRSVAAVIQKELDILRASLSFSTFGLPTPPSSPEVQLYLVGAEKMPLPETKELQFATSLDLIDWLRKTTSPLATNDLKRLVALTYETSTLPLIIENLVPGQADLWNALDLASNFSRLRTHLDFASLYLNTATEDFVDEKCQALLCDTIFTFPPKLAQLKWDVNLIIHRVSSSRQHDRLLRSHFFLLARILKASSTVLSEANLYALKEAVFIRPSILKNVMMSPSLPEVVQGIKTLLESTVDHTSKHDRLLVVDISRHWFNALLTGLDDRTLPFVSTACIWIKYLQPSHLFDLLDFLQKYAHNVTHSLVLQPLDAVLEALCTITSSDWQAEFNLLERLPQLLSLRPIMPDSPLLDQVIAIAIEASLPMGLDGCLPLTSSSSTDMVTVLRRSEARWAQRRRPVKVELDILSFLTQPTFSASIIKITCGLIYRQLYDPETFIQWLRSPNCCQRSAEELLPIVHAFLDSSDLSVNSSLEPDTWLHILPKIVMTITNQITPTVLRRQAHLCLTAILSTSGPNFDAILDVLVKELEHWPAEESSPALVFAGADIARIFGTKANPLLSIVLDKGMQLYINQIGEGQSTLASTTLAGALTSFLQHAPISKPHIVETLLTITIQSRFSSSIALDLAFACVSTCALKPVIVNRHLQGIIQHPHFFKIGLSPEHSEVRAALVKLLHGLFHLHPTNTSQITHIEPVIKIYGGTLSNSDLRILSIFQLFEGQRKLSVTPLLSRWSSATASSSHTPLEAIQSLDPILVLRTCLDFPRWRRLEDQPQNDTTAHEAVLYDPVFLMLLFSQMLSDQPPTSAFGWIELFRTNIVSLFVRALSSRDGQIRNLALCQVVGVWKQMQNADLQERPHVLHILDLLRDLIPSPVSNHSISATTFPPRLPTYTTLLLMHSLRAVFHPSNFIYPITARFLLQRPSLDIADVPMLYSLLYSSSDEHWKKERTWIIKFLADGMVSSEDWRVLKRRHTWDLLASLFQSSDEIRDSTLRMAIFEVLANLTCNSQATASLILKSSLLTWIEAQILGSATKTEGVEWIKILENITVVVDLTKIEASTSGEWRVIICRCLEHLLDENCNTSADNFPHAVPVILRLSSLPQASVGGLPHLLDLAVNCLNKIKGHFQAHDHSTNVRPFPCPPHRSQAIHQRLHLAQFSTRLLEMLWRASMSLDRTSDAWEKLTPRMLLLGNETNSHDAAEWTRKSVVLNLRGG
ncbi:hypothetical protein GALMADRAFT_250000 [Galerina marginata CBS 339.88]|uniref:Uncharacterized protein n=1 Tax=Galerina marginata (strain CBS 339.88) TaxID=685588 RepID=A0A067T5E6_GALM3|nr:hypothetical protein GALMADRAFT_250000 [Galerina marginata CBS 339.88]